MENIIVPVIRISDAAFSDLKSVSTWLGTKTPSATIEKLVAEKMDDLDLERDINANVGIKSGVLKFDKTPGLSHTLPLYAYIDQTKILSPRWSGVLIKTIEALKARNLNAEEIYQILDIPAQLGKHEGPGYKFYPEIGLSIQGQSAPNAWKEASRLAQKYNFPIAVKFKWYDKPKAQHPGRVGILNKGYSGEI